MKKKEQVEIHYIKQSTTLLIALFCLVAGFLIGVVYKGLDPSPEPEVSPLTETVQPTQPNTETAQQTSAVFKLKQYLDANSQDAEAWARLGHLYFDSDQFQEAIDAYKKSLEINPKDPNVWTDMGVMYRRNGNPRDAINSFDKAVQIQPNHQQSRFNKGVVLMHDLNDAEAAIKTWEELVRINPNATAPTGQPVKDLIARYRSESAK